MQINDCIVDALGSSHINDLLVAYFQSQGASSNNINDAEREFLIAQGMTVAANNAMWYELLYSLGYSGSLTDMWKDFWCISGGAVAELAFYATFASEPISDKISKQAMITILESGRPIDMNSGVLAGEDEPALSVLGLLTYGAYTNLITYSEDTLNWTGSGPWTQSVNLSSTGTYTISTGVAGATVTVVAGTAAIDASASATLGSPDQFVVTGTGTVIIETDVAEPKAQLTETPYRMPYVKTEASVVSVPLNYSDSDEGYKWQIPPDEIGSLYTGAVVGEELAINGDFDIDNSSDYVNVSNATNISVIDNELVFTAEAGSTTSIRTIGSVVVSGITPGTYRFSVSMRQKTGAVGKNLYTKVYSTSLALLGISSSKASLNTFQTIEQDVVTTESGTMLLYFYGSALVAGDVIAIDDISVKEVSRNMGLPLLFDALDGEADGVVILEDDFSTDTSSDYFAGSCTLSYNAIEEALKAISDITGQFGPAYLSLLTEGVYVEVSFRARGDRALSFNSIGDSGAIGVNPQNPVLSLEWQDYVFRITPSSTTLRIYLDGTGSIGDTLELDDILVKEISHAEGEMQVEWTPGFAYDDLAANDVSILTCDETGASSLLFHNGLDADMESYDNTTVMSALNVEWVSGTKYTIKVIWGTHPTEGANKMQIIVTDGTTTWESAVANFDGSFDPGDYFSIAWGNIYPQTIKSIKVYKEPQSW